MTNDSGERPPVCHPELREGSILRSDRNSLQFGKIRWFGSLIVCWIPRSSLRQAQDRRNDKNGGVIFLLSLPFDTLPLCVSYSGQARGNLSNNKEIASSVRDLLAMTGERQIVNPSTAIPP
jgi:hypothetical protein